MISAKYNVKEIAYYIISYSHGICKPVSNLKLQKLLYFVQGYFLAYSNGEEACFKEEIEAWAFGPVVESVYYEFRGYGSNDIPNFCVEHFNISNKDIEKIESVINMFKDYSANNLVTITHQQDPWKNTYYPYQNNIISKSEIAKYFIGINR